MQKKSTVAEVWQRKYPEQVVLAITRADDGRTNVMAVGWVAIVSDEPAMYMLGIDDNAYTLELIRKNKEFVIAFPGKAMAKETLYFGTVHGHDIDKGKASGLKFEPAEKVNAPLLADAVANIECKLVTEYRPGNCPLVIGEVIACHVNTDENIKRLINAGTGYDLQ
ncbi:MAG: flavin reductase family protein [Lentisphaeria bacterium]|nr:flavin reductase family protein [Lentisphaeria bacterium]